MRPGPTERLLIVGGDAAGMSAATAARRHRPDDLEVVAFESGVHTSYAACGLPYYLSGTVAEADALVVRSPEEHARRGVDVRTRHEVLAIDTDARTVRVRDLDAAEDRTESFDRLVVGTGARPVRPKVPGIDADGVHVVKTLAGAVGLRHRLETDRPRRAVLIGAGYIGIEVAEAFVERGIEVTLVDLAPQPMTTLDPDLGALVATALRERGVQLELDTGLEAIVEHAGSVSAVVTARGELPADLVVLGLGVRPEVALAEAAGLRIGPTGAIAVDDHMQTSVEGIYAAGDCIESRHRISGEPIHVALGTHANQQGSVAGVNAAGGDRRFAGVLGSAITKFFDTEIARTGLSEREAQADGRTYSTVTVETSTAAGYMPGSHTATVKLLTETGTDRLLGGQIVGGPGAGAGIKVIATALWNEMTTSEVAELDLPYVPPLGPVWDPVQSAARRHTHVRI